MFSYTLDGVPYADALTGIEDFILTLERIPAEEAILREFSDANLTFTGNAYCYLCARLAENYCNITSFDLYFDGELLFEGNIVASFGRANWNKRTYETQIIDKTFRALIASRAKNEVRLDAIVTVSCEDLQPITELMRQVRRWDGSIAGDRLVFNAYDVLQFVVAAISDNAVVVQSQYLQDNPYVITTGYNLANTAGLTSFKKYPLITFEKLYTELRKRFALYASFEIISGQPTLIIEPESYFFDSTSSPFALSDIPFDLEISVDEDRIFSISNIGNTDVDVNSAFNPFINNKVDGWQEVSFNTCGCISPDTETDVQDLTTDWIHDSGQILEAIENAKNEDKIFILECFNSNSDISIYPIVPTVNIYYNEKLRNKFIAENWSAVFLNCAYVFRSTDASLFAFNQTTGSPDCNLQTITFQFTPLNVSGGMRFFNVQADAANGLSLVSNAGSGINSTGLVCGNTRSRYTIQIEGGYSFRSQREFRFVADLDVNPANTMSITLSYTLEIRDIGGVLKFSVVDNQAAVLSNTQNTVTLTPSVITPLYDLEVGDYVEVIASVQATSPNPLRGITCILEDGDLRTNDDLMSCSQVPIEGDRIPYLLEFSAPLCKSDYDAINANRRSFIELGQNLKGWLKKVEYSPKGNANFTLLTDQIICNNE
jgi:hypothetical protein